jgi:hypothetical protein
MSKIYLHDEPPEMCCQASCEKVSWKVRAHGQQLVLGAGSQLDKVPKRWRRKELCCSCLRSSRSDLLHIFPPMLLSKFLETVLSVGHTHDHAHHGAPVKHQDLPISCRPWHPMPFGMEEDPLLPD